MKVLIVQRVITRYRFDLLKKLSDSFDSVGIVSSFGEPTGTLRHYSPTDIPRNIKIHFLKSIRVIVKGNTRSTSQFFYPQIMLLLPRYDVVVLEGVTNIFNNIYIVPLAKLLGVKIVWWDAGNSTAIRSPTRKAMDFFSSLLIRYSDAQFAYSSAAERYMSEFMGASNCHLLLNTIDTTYFDSIKTEVINNLQARRSRADKNIFRLLYVGVVEERKRILDLIGLVQTINQRGKKFELDIVGGGDYLPRLKALIHDAKDENIRLHGPIYDKKKLEHYYFGADLFVLPGDGGLAIAQSLLYGLPVVCVASDGTEVDYFEGDEYVLSGIEGLKMFLEQYDGDYDWDMLGRATTILNHDRFVTTFSGVLRGIL